MSTVTLTIGPKNYTIACADGEEPHIEKLGAMIAEKYAQLGGSRAPLEAQNLLFAALFLADELAEARKAAGAAAAAAPAPPPVPDADNHAGIDALHAAIARLEGELEAARKDAAQPAPALALAPAAGPQPDLFGGPAPADPLGDPLGDALAERLEALAARAEANVAALEAAVANA